jgi:YVTN family beta-propeller protein
VRPAQGPRLLLALALVLLALSAHAPGAIARSVYVTDFEPTNTVSVIDAATNQFVGTPITVGKGPYGIAIAPDGRTAYAANLESTTVSAIDTATNQVVGAPISVGMGPAEVAITPDGRTAYVTNFDDGTVSAVNLQTNQAVGPPISVGRDPFGIAVTPDGRTVYVGDQEDDAVSLIDTATNQVVGAPIKVGDEPDLLAITPDGRRVYVPNFKEGTVSVIDTGTKQVVGAPIHVGEGPVSVAIAPDGRHAYVANFNGESVSVIDTGTNQVVGAPIPVGEEPLGIAFTPDGRTAYVTNMESRSVSVIETESNLVVGQPITDAGDPSEVAITPDQPPLASFSEPRARPGVPIAFNAGASSDPDGSIGRYDWSFGDQGLAPNGGATPHHAFRKPGHYRVTLTVTDNEGCSTSLVFTGQTASCNGSASAGQTQTVKVAYPGVKVKCPRSAKPSSCRFALQGVTKRHRGKPETRLAKAKVKAGKSKIVSLLPIGRFRTRLAGAGKILIRETVIAGGSSRQTQFRRLKVVE